MKIEEVMQKLQYLTVEQVTNPKVEVEDLTNISPYLHPDDYLTYIVFLSNRNDLPEDEKDMYKSLIKALKAKEDQEIEDALKRFDNAS